MSNWLCIASVLCCCSDPKKEGDGLVSKRHPPSKQFTKRHKAESDGEEEDCKDEDYNPKKKTGKKAKEKKTKEPGEGEAKPKPKKRKVPTQAEGEGGQAEVKPKKKKKKKEQTQEGVVGTGTKGTKPAGAVVKPPKLEPGEVKDGQSTGVSVSKPPVQLTAQPKVHATQPAHSEMSIQTMESAPPKAKIDFYYNDSNAKTRVPLLTEKKPTTFEEEFLRKIAGMTSVNPSQAGGSQTSVMSNVARQDTSASSSVATECSVQTEESLPSMMSTMASKVPKGVGIFKLATMMSNGAAFKFPDAVNKETPPKKVKKKAAKVATVAMMDNNDQGVQANTWSDAGNIATAHSQFQNLQFFNPLKSSMGSMASQGTFNASTGGSSVPSVASKPISAILQANKDKRAQQTTPSSSIQQGMIPLSSISNQGKCAQIPKTLPVATNVQAFVQQTALPNVPLTCWPAQQTPPLSSLSASPSPSSLPDPKSPPPPILSPIPSPLKKVSQSPPSLSLSVTPSQSPRDMQALFATSTTELTELDPKRTYVEQPDSQPPATQQGSSSITTTTTDNSSDCNTLLSTGVKGNLAQKVDVSDLTPPSSIKSTDLRILEILAQAQRLKEEEEQNKNYRRQLEAKVSVVCVPCT